MSELSQVLAALSSVTARLASIEHKLGVPTPAAAAAAAAAPAAPAGPVAEFAAVLKLFDTMHDELAALADDNLTASAKVFVDAVKMCRGWVAAGVACKQPDPSVMQTVAAPLVAKVGELEKVGRSAKYSLMQNALGDAAPAAYFFSAEEPAEHVKESFDQGSFHSNRLMMQMKTDHPEVVDKVGSYTNAMKAWVAFAQKYYKKGFAWNASGSDLAAFNMDAADSGASAAAAAAPPKKAQPPPPPASRKPASPSTPSTEAAAPAAGAGNEALMAAIATSSTAGLRKVTDEMKTKNRPAEERTSVVPAITAPAASQAAKPMPKGAPSQKMMGARLMVSNIADDKVEFASNLSNSAYIDGCMRAQFVITNKVNNVTLLNCTDCTLIVDSVLSQVEVLNCKKITVVCRGSVRSMMVERCDIVEIELNEENYLGLQLITALSSNINLNLPKPADYVANELTQDDETIAVPVPFQFTSTLKSTGALATEPIKHA